MIHLLAGPELRARTQRESRQDAKTPGEEGCSRGSTTDGVRVERRCLLVSPKNFSLGVLASWRLSSPVDGAPLS
jgi:hypothetical protein